jgi:hypothetical protein
VNGYEWATQYSYLDEPNTDDPGCVDPKRGVYRYLDGIWSDSEAQARANFERFAARHPHALVELLRRPVGDVEVVATRGALT